MTAFLTRFVIRRALRVLALSVLAGLLAGAAVGLPAMASAALVLRVFG